MQVSGQVRCQECGHESDAQYRFCGMCGSRLPDLQPTAKPARQRSTESEPARPVSGPSFLGLADEPDSSVTYLLEDDQSSSHWGRRIFAFLFLAALAAAGWHWRQPLRLWAVNYVHRPANPSASTPTNGDTTYKAGPISTAGSEVAGSMPNGAAINQAPADNNAAQPAQASQPRPSPNPSTEAQAAQNAAGQGNAAAQTPAQPSQPTSPGSPQTAAPTQQSTTNSDSENKNAASPQNPAPSEKASLKKPVPAHDETADQTPTVDPEGVTLEAEGEKYLYGSGVSANCSHAQKSLLAAAQHANAKAESVLGTMYFTGHCVTRDLPLAYSWFAKSMQQDPSNARVERDLLLVWNQMTADQRQVAIHHR